MTLNLTKDESLQLQALTQIQKAAVSHMVLQIINADRTVAYEELLLFNQISVAMTLDTETFQLAQGLTYEYSCTIIRNLSEQLKRICAKLLVQTIDADSVDHLHEHQILNNIARNTGIDLLF